MGFALPMRGGCQCGRHRYEITAAPLTLYACHCTDCQTHAGSLLGMSMPVPRDGLHADLDALASWTKTAANGRTVKISFCADCGVRLFHEPARNPKIVNVKPGTLDDTAWVRPMGHLWLDSAQPWFSPPVDALHYAGQPDSFDDLFARFETYLQEIADHP